MHTGVSDPHPLVERDAELGQLHAALARVRDGRGELALVTGEAGSGKTTLIRGSSDKRPADPTCCGEPAIRCRRHVRSDR